MIIKQHFTIQINNFTYHIEASTRMDFDKFVIKDSAGNVISEYLGKDGPLRELWLSDAYRNSFNKEREAMEIDCVRSAVIRKVARIEDGRIAA